MFSELIVEKFHPLLSELGFGKKRISDDMIQYSSKRVIVTFSYDSKRSYEIRFTTRLISGEYEFEVGEICNCLNFSNQTLSSFIQIEKANIPIWITALYELLFKYKEVILEGDFSLYDCLKITKQKDITEYNLKNEMKVLLDKAKIAWDAKDYKKYITLVAPIEGALHASEKKKLEIALKHI